MVKRSVEVAVLRILFKEILEERRRRRCCPSSFESVSSEVIEEKQQILTLPKS